ncbi:spore coat associated protein CotJA [Bacillota bacterium LX-D]|nr:spore coat associated protein CotJA [Bacillota bacterium LX-D]
MFNKNFSYEDQYSDNDNRQNMQLARAYIPNQKFRKIFSPREALERGTIFSELYDPYHKRGYK